MADNSSTTITERLRGMDTANFTFAAIKGSQAGKEYYVTMCYLDQLNRIFIFNEESLPAELRAQRPLNKARIPKLAEYIVENPKDYVFSAITASIDGDINFESLSNEGMAAKMGTLTIPLSARLLINDGQHRRAAIERALLEQPELRYQSIAVVFFHDRGLIKSQQMFADLNQHAVRPTKSLGILYDHRSEVSILTKTITNIVPIFKGLIENEKTTISNRTNKLFTLSNLHQANMALLRKRTTTKSASKNDYQIAEKFWNVVTKYIPEWQMVIERQISCAELRKEYVHAHGVGIHAIGIAGGALIKDHPTSWEEKIVALKNIDWLRSNTIVWEGRAMVGGHMTKARPNLVLTASYLKSVLGVKLTGNEKKAEGILNKTRLLKGNDK